MGTPIGGTVEILSGLDPELLYRSPEPDDMAEKILQFLARSEAELKGLRERCRQFVLAHYDWDLVTQRLMEVMQELADRST
ncbi:MAG: glycosyltransferase [Candidatus Tectomicrobia bacterium]|uniref:Glycosyltransferase n=1 Tax=Tectimicrobiota bacterium TaxID=2528274 RepID=A0A932CPQ8_UNCTE|nr:glycosyltransferase [Candidatus Tectomicrobia bacterium]